MGTRAAAFTAKIRSLQEQCARLQNNAFPVPSGVDLSNILKYFSQTLLGVLKDVPSIPLDVICSADKDAARVAMFPSLDYRGLFNGIVSVLESLPQINSGLQVLGESLLHTVACLVPFLEHQHMDALPFLLANSLAVLPAQLHKEVVDLICFTLLPFTIDSRKAENQRSPVSISVPNLLMMAFHYVDRPALHSQLVECLMVLKPGLILDLFVVIAHGSAKARSPAVELLFQYWPDLNPSAPDRKMLAEKHEKWSPLHCQREACSTSLGTPSAGGRTGDESGRGVGSKMCMDHTIAINAAERPPPMVLCGECADVIYAGRNQETLVDLQRPMGDIAYTCENSACKAPLSGRTATATCFSAECTRYNASIPIRYCKMCHGIKHSASQGAKHAFHVCVDSLWDLPDERQMHLVEAIITLLKEAAPDKSSKEYERVSRTGLAAMAADMANTGLEVIALEERQLLSRYGVWLMVGLCKPPPAEAGGEGQNGGKVISREVLGRLLSALCQWFHFTGCLPDDQAGSALERLKGESIHGWIMEIVKRPSLRDVFISTLLPHPLDFAKVGGHWDTWPSSTHQIKEGFKRLLCLVPYDIITADVWGQIMPYWMEVFRHEVPEEELAELKILLSKVLDPDLGPLGLTPAQMYRFISDRFQSSSPLIQEQALYWIQILTMLEVTVPINLLFTMFGDAIRWLHGDVSAEKAGGTISPLAIVTSATPTSGPPTSIGSLVGVNDARPMISIHCDTTCSCYILMLDILFKQMELQEIAAHKGLQGKEARQSMQLILDIMRAPWPGAHTCDQYQAAKRDTTQSSGVDDNSSVSCLMCEMSAIFHQLAMMIMEYFAPSVEATMADLPTAATTALEARALERTTSGSAGISSPFEDESERAHCIESLPVDLRLAYEIMTSLDDCEEADIIYHLLTSLKYMALHAEIFNKAAKDTSRSETSGFIIWCVEHLLIPSLWNMCQAEFSQISEQSVPLLLHCVTLPRGVTRFWSLIEKDFHSLDWRDRFAAVERVTVLAHFVETGTVKNSPILQSSLANAFCFLVHCLDDVNATVAQRALLNLETIKAPSLKLLMWCLETQFDLIIVDRAMILQTVFQLYNHLSDRRFLTWDFLLNRFDALFMEQQVLMERVGEIAMTRDLKNTNVNSEMYQNKYQRVQEALAQTHIARSLSASLGDKILYKRPTAASCLARDSLLCASKEIAPMKKHSPTPAVVYRRKSSKLMAAYLGSEGSAPSGPPPHHSHGAHAGSGKLNSFFREQNQQAEESHLFHVIHRIRDGTMSVGGGGPGGCEVGGATGGDEHERDTIHSLVFLLMQFLSRPDESHPTEQKAIQRNQQIVLRHLNILMGLSPSEGSFLISPSTLRTLPVFNAFLTSLPKVLDFNFTMGNILLNTALATLIYSPAPSGAPASSAAILAAALSSMSASGGKQQSAAATAAANVYDMSDLPFYSLVNLRPHQRQSWLLAVVILLYKYEYTSEPTRTKLILAVVQIVLNTLESRFHRCRRGGREDQLMSHTIVGRQQRDMSDASFTRPSIDFGVTEPEGDHESDVEAETEKDRRESSPASEPKEGSIISDIGDQEERELAAIQESPTKSDESNESMVVADYEDRNGLLSEKTSEKLLMLDEEAKKKTPSPPMTQAVPPPVPNIPPPELTPKPTRHTETNLIETSGPETKSTLAHGSLKIRRPQREMLSSFKSSSVEMSYSRQDAVAASAHSGHGDAQAGGMSRGPIVPSEERLLPIGVTSNRTPLAPYDPNKLIELHKAVQATPPFSHVERLLPIGLPIQRKGVGGSGGSIHRHAPLGPALSAPIAVEEDLHEELHDEMPSHGTLTRNVSSGEVKRRESMKSSNGHGPLSPKESLKSVHKTTAPTETVSKPVQRVAVESLNEAQVVVTTTTTTISTTITTTTTASCDQKENELVSSVVTKMEKMCVTQDPQAQSKSKSSSRTPRIKKMSSGDGSDRSANKGQLAHKTSDPTSKSSAGMAARQQRAKKSSSSGIMKDSTGSGRDRDDANLGGGGSGGRRELHDDYCPLCGQVYELFLDEELSTCIVILRAFVHREPAISAPILPQVLQLVARYALHTHYPWQAGSIVHLPGNSTSVARQFIRCTLHQLSANGIFLQIFASSFTDAHDFFRAMAASLSDSSSADVNQVSPLVELFEDLNERKHLPQLNELLHLLENVATYMECIAVGSGSGESSGGGPSAGPLAIAVTTSGLGGITSSSHHNTSLGALVVALDTFWRRFSLFLTSHQPPMSLVNMSAPLRIMAVTMKSPTMVAAYKQILDPSARILSFAVEHSPLRLDSLMELCHLCARMFLRERDRYALGRSMTTAFTNGIKFRINMPDENMILILQMALLDSGGTLPKAILPSSADSLSSSNPLHPESNLLFYQTYMGDCLKSSIADLLEFVADIHALSKVKQHFVALSLTLDEETLGGHLKAGIAQYLALELSRSSASSNANGAASLGAPGLTMRDANKSLISRHLPWLFSLPSLQQGSKEFMDCVGHIRLLSWLLLGSIQHYSLTLHTHSGYMTCQPITLEVNTHIAEHIQVVIALFSEQSKSSVLHMSSLFHAFILCQLWTVYAECMSQQSPAASEQAMQCLLVLCDFWAKITPGILQLVCHSKSSHEEYHQLAEMVCLHFVSLMEALAECNSIMLAKLMPMWIPVFNTYRGQLVGPLRVRLESCIDWEPPAQTREDAHLLASSLNRWTQRIQFKIAQIEMQSSQATQFYCL